MEFVNFIIIVGGILGFFISPILRVICCKIRKEPRTGNLIALTISLGMISIVQIVALFNMPEGIIVSLLSRAITGPLSIVLGIFILLDEDIEEKTWTSKMMIISGILESMILLQFVFGSSLLDGLGAGFSGA